MSTLTPKQTLFVEQYLLDLNATQAAIRAGYRAPNRLGPRLLGNANVRAAIGAALAERSDRAQIDADWVLTRLAEEAKADLADIYADDGTLLPIHAWPMVWRRGLVTGVETEELFEGAGSDRTHIGHVRKIRLDNRVRRIELIGKHVAVNAFQEQVAVKGMDGLSERLARAIARKNADRDAVVIEIEAVEPSQDDQPAAPEPIAAPQRAKPRPAPPLPPPAPAYRPILAPYPEAIASVTVDYDPFND